VMVERMVGGVGQVGFGWLFRVLGGVLREFVGIRYGAWRLVIGRGECGVWSVWGRGG